MAENAISSAVEENIFVGGEKTVIVSWSKRSWLGQLL